MSAQKFFTQITLVLMLVLFSLSSSAQARTPQADYSAVDTYVEAQREKLHIPGIAVAIVQGDQIVHLGSYGEAAKGRPVTPQTPFLTGSTGKSFTALAVMQLVEAGKIELDAPVQTYIPWFHVADPLASAQITVKQLLTQTSGFSNSAGLQELVASDLSDQAIENSVRALADVELLRAPGEDYEYSNLNFTILGLVVQVVSGQSYESYMQEHIFDPLDMRHSFTSQDEAKQNGMSTGYSTFFGIPLAKDQPFNRGNIAGGYLMISAEDMAHYLIAQLNQGRYGETSVLSPAGMDAMRQPIVSMGVGEDHYGMGWVVGPVNGNPVVWHDGENVNFSTFMLTDPQAKLGIALLSNANGTFVSKANSQIGEGVYAILLGQTPQPYEKSTGFYMTFLSTFIPALISLLWVGWTLYRFLRRQKQTSPIMRDRRWWMWVIAVPIFVDLNLLIMALVFIPSQWGLPFDGMLAMFPDAFLMLIGSAILVAVWSMVRTVLSFRQSNETPKVTRTNPGLV